MSARWSWDRSSPGFVLVSAIVVLIFGGFVAPRLLSQGGGTAIFGAVWLVVAVGQLIYAAWRFWKAGTA